MPKMTLLSMVQNILSAMDSDEVNSIHDTVESLQVAEVIKETFYEQFNNIEIKEWEGPLKLDSVSDTDRPNYLELPPNVLNIDWIKYRNDQNNGKFQELCYETPECFWKRQLEITPQSFGGTNIQLVTDASGIEYYIQNNKAPNKYTIVQDLFLVCDSYDIGADTTLQSSKTFAWGTVEPDFVLDDEFIPHIDANLFPLLLAESKSTCFINFKQISSSKEEQRARRQRIRMQNDQYRDRNAQQAHIQSKRDYSRKPR